MVRQTGSPCQYTYGGTLMKIILSLDLGVHVSVMSRELFFNELAKRHWVKLTALTTLWHKIHACSSYDESLQQALTEVSDSALASGVDQYAAAVIAAATAPLIWRSGEHTNSGRSHQIIQDYCIARNQDGP